MSRRVSPVGSLLCNYNILKKSKHLHSSLNHKGKLIYEGWGGETMKVTEMRKCPFFTWEREVQERNWDPSP